MQVRKGYLMLAFAAVAGLSAADGTDSANVMMEAAHKKEVVDGDLNGAIKQYHAIVAKYAGNRAVSAMALVHMAECYQKMGDAESRKIYERVLREYGDQKEAASTAQARLGGSGESRKPDDSGVLAKRMVCAECFDDEGDYTPDGRARVFTDWDSGDLAIRDMATGKVKRLMAKTGTWKDSDAYAESPLFTRDLRQIVYFWGDDAESVSQVRIMPNEPGGKARVLFDNPEYRFCGPQGWLVGGKSILVTIRQKDNTRQIARVSVPDGAVKVLKSLDLRTAGIGSHATVSPDGRYIAYHAHPANPRNSSSAIDAQDAHIYVLAADGSTETEIVKTAGINQYPVWAPDGKHIIFISDRSGKPDLWSIAVQNGKAVSPASLVSTEIGKVVGARMVGNSFYYISDFRTEYVNVADLTPGRNGKSRIAHATESFIGLRPAWSPDGKSIAFKRHHPGNPERYDVVVHSLESGDERTYRTDLGTSGPNAPPIWSHDGKSIFTAVSSGNSEAQIDVKTGDAKVLPMHSLPPSALSPDDKIVYIARNDPKEWTKLPGHILAVNLTNGQETPVFTMPEPGYTSFLLTPDGRTFVVRRSDQKEKTTHFYRLNIDGTGYREIYAIPQKEYGDNFALTNDGRSILLARRREGAKNWQFVRIPIEGGVPESTGVELEDLYDRSIDLSPDGARIAYSTGKSNGGLWTIDNVLSVVK